MRYRPHEFADVAGVTVKTLHRWDKSGKLKANRTQGGHRFYDDSHVAQIKGLQPRSAKSVIYCRVSSHAQKPELVNQVEAMQQFCTAKGVEIGEIIQEIGGGLNFNRKKFLALLASIMSGNVSAVYVAHKDRLCRFGFDLVEQIAGMKGCEIVVVNNTALSPQPERVEDMMAIIHCFSCRLYGQRDYPKKFRENLDKNLGIQVKADGEVQC